MDIDKIISAGGILAVAALVFAESGLLVGFFLPGDSLLFSAGIIAAQGKMDIVLLIVAICIAAIAGDNVGYSFGRRVGKRLHQKDGVILRKDHIAVAERFYEKHGKKTIILARFVPAVRTFAPIVAGAGKMERKTFMKYNIIGALLWGIGITLLGYVAGDKIPNIEKYVTPVIIGAMLLSFGPALLHVLKDKRARDYLAHKILRK